MDLELKQHLEAMESRIIAHTEAHVDASLEKLQAAIEDRMTKKMRGMQTEVLRGLRGVFRKSTIRMPKVEVD